MCKFDSVSAASQRQSRQSVARSMTHNELSLGFFDAVRTRDTFSMEVMEEDDIEQCPFVEFPFDSVTPAAGSSSANWNHIGSKLYDTGVPDESECLDLIAFDELECFHPTAFDDEYAEFMCQIYDNEHTEHCLSAPLLTSAVTPNSESSVAKCSRIEPQLLDLGTADELECFVQVAFDEPECFDHAAFDDEYAEFMCQVGKGKGELTTQCLSAIQPTGTMTPGLEFHDGDCNQVDPQLLDLTAPDEPECSDLVAFDEPECFDPAAFDDEYAEFMRH